MREGTREGAGDRTAGDPPLETVAHEHRRLDELLARVRAALDGEGNEGSAQAAISRLEHALEAHFLREESLYYPTLWALRPELESPLRRLTAQHAEFRSRLSALAEALDAGTIPRARLDATRFVELFGEHESAEERALEGLEADPG
jgi:hemerythrin-like domain-containing protein